MKTLLAFLALASSAHAATVVQLNFADSNSVSAGTIGSSGTWYTLDADVVANTNVTNLKDSTNTDTGISLTLVSGSGFQNNGRAEGGTNTAGTALDGLSTWTAAASTRDPNSGVTYTADNKFFPWAVVGTYAADNTSSGRDGLISFTFASDTQLNYSFFVMSSYDNGNPTNANGLFNIGGTYSTTTNAFTGGTTLALNGAKQQQLTDSFLDSGESSPGSVKYETGRLGTSFQSVFNSATAQYELTFQGGIAAGGSAGVYLNGLIIEAAPIPEPSTVALLLLGIASLTFKRRRY